MQRRVMALRRNTHNNHRYHQRLQPYVYNPTHLYIYVYVKKREKNNKDHIPDASLKLTERQWRNRLAS